MVLKKPNEKLLCFVIILLWEVIYAHFYNWDSPLYFVLVVYDLIELIIKTSLWFKDYSTFDTHTQHTRLCSNNAYLIYVIVHVQMWCVCSSSFLSNPKRFFECFICFWKWFYTFVSLVFLSKCIFVCVCVCVCVFFFFPKTGSEAVSWEARDLELLAKVD